MRGWHASAVPRFSRAELESFRDVEVPDLLGDDLRLLFVGINPGLWTAATQTHFAHPGNRFYPALLRAGIIERPIDPAAGMTDADRDHLRGRGIGITNLVRRATARADELSAAELREGGGAWRSWYAGPRRAWSRSPASRRTARRSGTRRRCRAASPSRSRARELWVVPNPSGLNAHETVATLAAAYAGRPGRPGVT